MEWGFTFSLRAFGILEVQFAKGLKTFPWQVMVYITA